MTMPSHPILLRTSAPSAVEMMQHRLSEAASAITARKLSKVLGKSETTARRRQTGRGWTVAEVVTFAASLGVAPTSFFSE